MPAERHEAHEADRAEVDAFAAAVGAEPGPVAPPTFAAALVLGVLQRLLADPATGLGASGVVHREQEFACERPIRAGDRLAVSVRLESVKEVARRTVVLARGQVSTAAGEPVCRTVTTLVLAR
ncbi:FAS1-like dehydratase domain-containing protein [Saccharothrix australiensis]|uniref:MaoC dehydratase-like protein n=1 Tax=Saccharothrix australiensis TaxID=2072 RepID=A0A495W779_9PSEU|nr:MaoC family dehydratase N-terminal domain-containing protein [Saccharothrix australiensis]RKT55658.1 MaoC dehydratase-like protein [Saccharothrix australiensis]